MLGDGSAASAVLGLPGFVLLTVSEVEGELEQAIETTSAEEFCRRSACGRGRMAAAGAGARPAGGWAAGDADLGEADVAVRRIAVPCEDLDRDQRAPGAAGGADRAGPAEACRRVGEDGHDVSAVAVEYGVGWHTIVRAVRDHGRIS